MNVTGNFIREVNVQNDFSAIAFDTSIHVFDVLEDSVFWDQQKVKTGEVEHRCVRTQRHHALRPVYAP